MNTFAFGNKAYQVDTEEFLSDFNEWDENFARGVAPKVGIISGLSEDHWKIIHFIRDSLSKPASARWSTKPAERTDCMCRN